MDELHPEPLDLSPLDLRADRERWEGMVARIVSRAAAPRTPFTVLVGWRRPALAAAAAIAALSAGVLWREREAVASPGTSATVVEALEMPRPVEDWVIEGRAPHGRDVLVAVDELP
jgi:hypothetical protein